ncbi:MAG TPA: hypothetical protein VNX46_17120, partial [Candidatus Acidoferrum sp.]|nr:hypothetical protein [Candidatus Acidoferrum sp.]
MFAEHRPIAFIAESSAIGVGSDVRLVMVNYAFANCVGTTNAGVNVGAPATLEIIPQTQAGSPWVGWAQLRNNGEGKNQKTGRFASGEFNSDQTSVKHPQEERIALVDIAAEERGL